MDRPMSPVRFTPKERRTLFAIAYRWVHQTRHFHLSYDFQLRFPTLNQSQDQDFQLIKFNYQGKNYIGGCKRNFSLAKLTMILKCNSDLKTHYDILGVKEDASFNEIRSAYRSALLNVHPDKQKDRPEASIVNNDPENRFLEVQKSWEILGNPMTRAVYDHDLQASRQDAIAGDDISLEDMSFEDVGDGFELLYACRCGDYFSIGSSELEEMGYPLLKNASEICLQNPESLPASVVLSCGSCSLKLNLLISEDTSLLVNSS